ncbi:MAG: hypothetical protein AB8C46_18245 [Burkholderiaceae bacterium]
MTTTNNNGFGSGWNLLSANSFAATPHSLLGGTVDLGAMTIAAPPLVTDPLAGQNPLLQQQRALLGENVRSLMQTYGSIENAPAVELQALLPQIRAIAEIDPAFGQQPVLLAQATGSGKTLTDASTTEPVGLTWRGALALADGIRIGAGDALGSMVTDTVALAKDLSLAGLYQLGWDTTGTRDANTRVGQMIEGIEQIIEDPSLLGEAFIAPVLELKERYGNAIQTGRAEDWQLVGESLGALAAEGAVMLTGSGLAVRAGTKVVTTTADVASSAAIRTGKLVRNTSDDIVATQLGQTVVRVDTDNIRIAVGEGTQLNGGIPVLANNKVINITRVTDDMRARHENNAFVDPMTNELRQAKPGEKIHVDHTLPVNEIVNLPGFTKLTPDQMRAIIQDDGDLLGNLQPMPSGLNMSKQHRVGEGWTHYKGEPLNPDYLSDLSDQQSAIRQRIQTHINDLLASNQGAN